MGYLRDVSVFIVGLDQKSLKHFIKKVLALLTKVIRSHCSIFCIAKKVYVL